MEGDRPRGVLLVEDDVGDAHLFRAALHGTAVAGHATSLAAALDWLDEHGAEVVVLDLGLSDSTGLVTLQRLLEAHPETPVVVLSSHDDDELATAAVEAGAQEYLVKGSADGPAIRRTLRHAIERHRLQAELRARVKEMFALYAISRELHTDGDLEPLLGAIAAHLRAGMQRPERCHVEVTVDDATAVVGPDDTLGPAHVAPVRHDERERGRLRVQHAEDRPFTLPFEQALLDTAAEAVELWLGRHDAVRTLRTSEERLRVLVAQLPGLVWTTDADLRVTSAGGVLLDQYVVDPDAILGVPVTEVLDVDPPGETLAHLDAALAGTASSFERRWRGRWWRNHVSPKCRDDGEVVGVLCLSLDITEEKARAAELAETRARLQGLFDNASDAIILADDSGTYLDANPAACDLTGYTRAQLVGMRPWDLTPSEVGEDASRTMWDEFLAAGSMAGEYGLVRTDGTTVEVDFRAVADIVPGVHLSVLRDISARKRTEAALALSEARFRMMAEAAQDAVYRVRTVPDLEIEYLSPAAETISGFAIQDFVDDPRLYTERAHPDDVHLFSRGGSLGSAPQMVTVRFRHAEGHWIWLEDSRSPIVEDGEPVGVQGVIRDVTARERTQRALEDALEAERQAAAQLRSADQLKSHFLQAVSHELRTPLTSVLGISEMLVAQRARLDQGQAEHLQQRVLVNARRLDRLLTDLLDLERLQHQAARLERQDTDLTDLVTAVCREIDLGGRTLRIEDGPAEANLDPARVERIVHNLVANAVKHTPPGTTITVRCDADDDGATIEVVDDGPGVPEELARAIFEPFRQGPRSYGEASPGTGIGLSIVQQFAALHGGNAWVRPTPGGGATFAVRLPSAQDGQTDDRPAAEPPIDEPRTRAHDPARPDGDQQRRDADAIASWATRELLTVTSRQEIVGVLLRAVHQLGGWAVPARASDDRHALPLDISLGTSEPLLAAAEPGSAERHLLERHLPRLVADARQAADTVAGDRRVEEALPGPRELPS